MSEINAGVSPPAGVSVKKSISDGFISSGGHSLCSILQTAKLLPGAPQQPPKSRTGISKPYNVKQIKTTTPQEAEEAIRCLMQAKGVTPEEALAPISGRTQTVPKSESFPGVAKFAQLHSPQPPPVLIPQRPAPKVPSAKKPAPLQRMGGKPGCPPSPEEQFEQSVGHFSFALPESCLEARAIATSPTRAAPVPKPRTVPPGKILERRSSERYPAALRLLEESSCLPSQNSTHAPRVPPRRKKSAPPDFHLQVLQSSDSLFLKGLTFNSNNNNNPSHTQSDSIPLSPSEPFLPAAAGAMTSPIDDDSKPLRLMASELISDLQVLPPMCLQQQHQQLSDDDFLRGSTSLLDLETDFIAYQSIPQPLPISPTHAPKDVKLPSASDFSHWVTFGEEGNSGTISESPSVLVASKQKQNACVDPNTSLKL